LMKNMSFLEMVPVVLAMGYFSREQKYFALHK
jgi:hypothetical protein